MRKTVVALILLLPILFVLAVFSSVKTVSLGIPVSASGIEILERPEGDVFRIDLATYENNYSVKARVTPEAATNREYICKVDEGDAVTIDENGVIRAQKTGEARISVVSKDGGYEDSLRAIVYSTQPYDFRFEMKPLGQTEEIRFTENQDEYFATVRTGTYSYAVKTLPEGFFSGAEISAESGTAVIDRAAGTILFPFGGETVLNVSLACRRGGKPQDVVKKIVLNLEKLQTASGFVVNGGNSALVLDKDSDEASFYIEGEEPKIGENPYISESRVEALGENRYKVTVVFREKEDFLLLLEGESGETEEVSFSFEEFDFSLRSNLPVLKSGEAEVLLGVPVSFYAVPSVAASGITYEWSAPQGGKIEPKADGAECLFTAEAAGEYLLTVRALRRGVPFDIFEKKLIITAVPKVSAVQFALKTDLGLSKRLVIAGEKYEGDKLIKNAFPLPIVCYNDAGEPIEAEMELFSSDENIAKIENGCLIPVGTGEVTVTANWPANDSFGTNIGAKISVFVVGDAVQAENSPELFSLAAAGRKIVLTKDILLGTNENGEPLPISERQAMLKTMKSTFNMEYYQSRGEEANIQYVLEIQNDLYGNGCTLNAELFTAAKDGTGQPRFFRGPLDFVRFGQMASVAAQDNICFLLRTNGVTLYNVTLLGCSDEVLAGESGYDLSALNTVGTTLEVNASAKIINCRIRNGRTVMRVYGGNREGEHYFTERLEELGDRAVKERITVQIEGCILSHGREFLLKIGANGALRSNAESASPTFLDENGAPYPHQSNQNANDRAFYEKYVFTDVTLSSSVLEKSGFFTVGVESNFSGELLQSGGESGALEFEGWRGTGGTSFASILRLEGDVRLYDWKELALIDSSTLIDTELPELKLDIAAMLNFVCGRYPERYGEILDDGYVHGGIAFYGGGKNYSQLVTENLNEAQSGFGEYKVNISVLGEAEGSAGYLGQILPAAAGEEDFRFYLYNKSGKNSRANLQVEENAGKKYSGVNSLPPNL